MQVFTIGQIAQQAEVGIETVRFYERQGLLAPPPRGTSGYRQYPPDSVQRLRFIRRAKALGFSLAEIRSLLSLHPGSAQSCTDVSCLTRDKIADIDAKIRDLESVRRGLEALAASCERREPLSACPLLAALGAAEESR